MSDAKREKPVAGLRPPEPISEAHDLSGFDSGEPTPNDCLRRRAHRNERGGASRTYVVCQQPGNRVVGYYCLAAGAVAHAVAPSSRSRTSTGGISAFAVDATGQS